MPKSTRVFSLTAILLMMVSVSAQPAVTFTPVHEWGRGHIYDVAFNSRGTHMAVATPTGVYLYETAMSPEVEPRHIAPGQSVERVALSPDARYIAAIAQESADVLLFDASGTQITPFHAVAYSSWPLAFAPDGEALMTVDSDGYLNTYDSSTGERLSSQKAASLRFAADARFTPDGRFLSIFTSSFENPVDSVYEVWRTAPLERVASFPSLSGRTALALTADGAEAAWLDQESNVSFFDVSGGQRIAELPQAASQYPFVFTAGTQTLAYSRQDGLTVWNIGAQTQMRIPHRRAPWVGAVFSPSDETLFVWNWGMAELHRVEPDGATTAYSGYSPNVYTATADFSEDVLTVATERGEIVRWDLDNDTRQVVAVMEGNGPLDKSLAESVRGQVARIDTDRMVSADLTVRAGETLLYSEQLSLACGASAVTYSPDGTRLVLASGGTLTLYDAATFTVIGQADIPCAGATAMILTASGRYLALFQEGGIGTVYEVTRA